MNTCKNNLLLVISLILLASCSVERRLAQEFIKEHKHGAVMLIAPDYLYKSSYKVPYIKNFDALPQQEKDSIAYFNSDIVQFCDDSAYISYFIEGLKKGFTYFGLTVYEGNAASDFLNHGDEAYIFNLAQIQLEEYFDSISDATSYDTESANTEAIFITAINLNNWIEITKLNHVKSDPQMLFSSQSITDDFKGNFIYYPLTGDFDYNYTIDSLTVEKLYNSARTLGFRHSQWLFDYLMNDFVMKSLPQGQVRNKLFTYDFEYRILKKLKWEPFTEINEE